jgi:hypothetical protein
LLGEFQPCTSGVPKKVRGVKGTSEIDECGTSGQEKRRYNVGTRPPAVWTGIQR